MEYVHRKIVEPMSSKKRSIPEENGAEDEAKRIRFVSGDDQMQPGASKQRTLHLDQIKRGALDFDMEKVCSVTLWPRSVYCCLACGKYLQGRGSGSQLHMHSLEASHFVAMSLANGTVYSMPDGEIIEDASLDDIKYNLRPTFSEGDLVYFATVVRAAAEHRAGQRDFRGTRYYPGLVGMNDSSGTDYMNALVQSLVRLTPLRDFFLIRANWETSESRVTRAFGELTCQMFSARRFKHTLSPNELVQSVSAASKGRFQPGTRTDAKDFFQWLLLELHRGTERKGGASVVTECFQGEVRVETTVFELRRDFGGSGDDVGAAVRAGPQRSGHDETTAAGSEAIQMRLVSNQVDRVRFNLLSLDLPTMPLFTDLVEERLTLPQTTLLELIHKFDGVRAVDVNLPGGRLEQKRYLVTRLPKCLCLHLARFSKMNNTVEKNRTVVSLPLADLDMAPFLESTTAAASTKFNLMASVIHEGGVGPGVKNAIAEGSYKAMVYYPPRDAWFECNNLSVKHIDMPQLVSVAETFMAFFERREN